MLPLPRGAHALKACRVLDAKLFNFVPITTLSRLTGFIDSCAIRHELLVDGHWICAGGTQGILPQHIDRVEDVGTQRLVACEFVQLAP